MTKDVHTIEAEHMRSRNFDDKHGDNASGGEFVKLESRKDGGWLKSKFDGEDGSYNVSIFVQDETDGESHLRVKIGGEEVDVSLDRGTDGRGSNDGGFTKFDLGTFDIEHRDNVKVYARKDGDEWVRIDRIEFEAVAEEPPADATPYEVSVEAEDFDLTCFDVVHNGDASGDAFVRIDGHAGLMTTHFDGVDGTYDIEITAQDEWDGASSVKVFVNGEEVGTIVLAGQETTGGSDHHGLDSVFTLEGVEIGHGDKVELLACRDAGEYVRLDKVAFRPAATPEPVEEPQEPAQPAEICIEAEDFELTCFDVVHKDHASGDAFVKIDGHSGKLTTHFGGVDGTYDLCITAQDEWDGASSIKVVIDGEEVGTIVLAGQETTAGSDHHGFDAVYTLEGVEIGEGDRIELIACRDGGEYVRLDKVTFKPAAAPDPVEDPENPGDQPCEPVCIDFESDAEGNDLQRGNLIDGLALEGVTFYADRSNDGDLRFEEAMIFDADNWSGGDSDLSQPGQGNVLIVSEDRDTSDPDDNGRGGTIVAEFDQPSTLESITILDTETPGGTIVLETSDGSTVEIEIPRIANGGIQTVDLLGTENVVKMTVAFPSSGAIDDLCFKPTDCAPAEDPGDPTPPPPPSEEPEDPRDPGTPPSDDCVTNGVKVTGQVNVDIAFEEEVDASGRTVVRVTIDVLDETGEIGDLRGFFAHIGDESLLSGLSFTGDDITGTAVGADGVSKVDNNVNMNGGGTSRFDFGVQFGTNGEGADDIRSTEFVISHASEDLGVELFNEQEVGLRLQSVGPEGGGRGDSLKLVTTVPPCEPKPPADMDDCEEFAMLADGTEIGAGYTGVDGRIVLEGVTFSADKSNDGEDDFDDAMIFDAANWTGGDSDLDQPTRGNVLIISEDGDRNDPDDNARGGTIKAEFLVPSTVTSIAILDTETPGGTIDLILVDGTVVTFDIPTVEDGGIQELSLGPTENVVEMLVNFPSSGAVDCLKFEPTPPVVQEFGSLSGRYFCDENRDDLDDNNGDEPPVVGATVTLFNADGTPVLDGNGQQRTEITDANGEYRFGDLVPGSYYVEFEDPATAAPGKEFVAQTPGDNDAIGGSDADPANGTTPAVEVFAGQETTDVDAGVFEPLGALSGRYFCDENRNDLDDNNGDEAPVVGATVLLFNADGTPVLDGNGQQRSQTTDANGSYLFTGLVPGEYFVEFEDPATAAPGKLFVAQTPGDNDAIGGSDADPLTGITPSVAVVADQTTTDVDAGVYNTPPTALGDMGKACADGVTEIVLEGATNDTDAESATLTVTEIAGIAVDLDPGTATPDFVELTSGPLEGGVITLQSDGTLVFDQSGVVAAPTLLIGEQISDSFDYTVADEAGATATGSAMVELCGTLNTIETISDRLPTDAMIDINVTSVGRAVGSTPVEVDFSSAERPELNGTYFGFCIEPETQRNTSPGLDAVVYSSYEDLPQPQTPEVGDELLERIDNIEFLDEINWILNNVDLDPSTGPGFTHIQDAIWSLIDGELSQPDEVANLDPVAAQIRADALAAGEDEPYVPGMDGSLGVIFEPAHTGTEAGQIYIVAIPVEVLEEDCLCV